MSCTTDSAGSFGQTSPVSSEVGKCELDCMVHFAFEVANGLLVVGLCTSVVAEVTEVRRRGQRTGLSDGGCVCANKQE